MLACVLRGRSQAVAWTIPSAKCNSWRCELYMFLLYNVLFEDIKCSSFSCKEEMFVHGVISFCDHSLSSVPLHKYTVRFPLSHCKSTPFLVLCLIAKVHCSIFSDSLQKYTVLCPLAHCRCTPFPVLFPSQEHIVHWHASNFRCTLFHVLSFSCTLFAVLCPSLDYPVLYLLSHCRLHCSLSFVSLQKYTVPCPLSYWRSILFYVLFQNS